MIDTRSIYNTVGERLYEREYWEKGLDEKKEMINEELINYTQECMSSLGITYENQNSENRLVSMLDIIDSAIPAQMKDNFFRHYTHFLLNIVGELQLYCIPWWSSVEGDPYFEPSIEPSVDEPGKWESFSSHRDTNPVEATKYVLDAFMKSYMVDKMARVRVKGD